LELMVAGTFIAVSALGWVGWKTYSAEAGGEELARQRGRAVLSAAADWKRDHVEPGCPSITQLQRASLLAQTARAEDPWGQRYRIVCVDNRVQVLSAGRDGRFETADDIALAAEPNS
jgi:hypothetical protein